MKYLLFLAILTLSACASSGVAYGLKKDGATKEEATRDYYQCHQTRNYDACMGERGWRMKPMQPGDVVGLQ